MANNDKTAGSMVTGLMEDFLGSYKDTGFKIEELQKIGEEIKNVLTVSKVSTQKTEEVLKSFVDQLKNDAQEYKAQSLNVSQIKSRIEELINKNAVSSARGKDSAVDINSGSELAKQMKESIDTTKKIVDALQEILDNLGQTKFAAGAKIQGMFKGVGRGGKGGGNNNGNGGGTASGAGGGPNNIGSTITSFFTSRTFWGKFASGIIEGIMGAKMLKKGFLDVIHLGVLLLTSWIKKTFGGIPAAIAYIAATVGLGMVGGRVVRGALKLGTTAIRNPRTLKRFARMKKMQFTRGVGNTLGLLTNPAKMGNALKNAGKGGLDFIMGTGRNIGKGVKGAISGVGKVAGTVASIASKGGKGVLQAIRGVSGATKTGFKALGKGAGKAALKKIPVAGLLAGGLFAAQRAMGGDWAGAGLELASGAASTIPGVGTATSLGIDAALMAKDAGVLGKKDPRAGGAGSQVVEQAVKEEKDKNKEQKTFWKKILDFISFLNPVCLVIKKIAGFVRKILEKFGLIKRDESSKSYLQQLGVKTFHATETWNPTGWNPNSPDDNNFSGYGKSWGSDTFDGHRITSQYGGTDSLHPTGHKGVDLAYKKNEKVGAKVAGTVTYAGPCEGYGNLVIIEDDKQYKHYYGHLAKIGVAPDQEVTAGETIGLAGSTGHSTGVHLHYEVRKPGQKNQLAYASGYDVDPLVYLTNYRRAKNATEGKQIDLNNTSQLRDGSSRSNNPDAIVQKALNGNEGQNALENVRNNSNLVTNVGGFTDKRWNNGVLQVMLYGVWVDASNLDSLK